MNWVGWLCALPLRGMVWFYRYAVSPFLGAKCRFEPTCSAYAEEALQAYGAFKGCWFICKRIVRCHPFGGSGYDPVPGIDEPPSEAG